MRDSAMLLALAEESAGVGVWDHDLATGLTHGTPQFYRIHGLPADHGPVPIEKLRALRHPDDRDRVVEGYRRALDSGEDQFESEYRIVLANGAIRWIFGRGRTIRDAAGRPLRYSGVDLDITDRKCADDALRVSEARLEQAVRVAGLGIFDYDHPARSTHWSPEMHALWGWPGPPPPDLRGYLRQVDPADRDAVVAAIAAARRPGSEGVFETEHRLRQPDGGVRWVAIRGRTLFDGTGVARRAIRSIGAMRDITERKQAEEHIRLLMREVNHRANNLLAVVVAVARQMADTAGAAHFASRLAQRLVALSASHKLLLAGPLEGTDLADLVTSQLGHFHELLGGRVQLNGPPLRLTPQAVQAVGMALHELATNAGKYGALSDGAGKVRVDWTLVHGEGGDDFHLAWRESGGPPVLPPVRTGFGHTVMVRMMERAVAGKVDLEFAPEGLRWTLTCPADQALEKT